MTVYRRRLTINGIVQGVGFRPFIFKLAKEIGLSGSIFNASDGVIIELQGTEKQHHSFDSQLKHESPPLSLITAVESEQIPECSDSDFIIIASQSNKSVSTLISPDVALCEDCRLELFDSQNRRHLYPFINCTNCGPRYTIIENIPYDRPFTSMKHFPLCPACQAEYDDPLDRRFHAQPNACPVCGPSVWLVDKKGSKLPFDNPVLATIKLLTEGNIIAIKGLGGFHLAVNPLDPDAVKKLREVKGRDEKPFALMVRDLQIARSLIQLSEKETVALTSIQAPIVLASALSDAHIAENVAPGNDRLGIMLPYTPLHHLLLSGNLSTLVMTSANYSEEPICIENDEALKRLAEMADYYLLHNRDIYLRSDDSVVMEIAGDLRPIRRSRGYAPRPILLQNKGPSVLAVGGELKNVIGLSKDDKIFLSQHIGDLENLEAFEFFQMTIQHLQRIFEIEPELIVHDLHPDYLSSKWAKDQNIPLLGVQHHHAHLVACMAEHNLDEPVIGIIMDGTGYGSDGTIWGGEFLVGEATGFTRRAHFEPMPLPGGGAAIKAPWRTGLSYLYGVFGDKLPEIPALRDHDIQPIIQLLDAKLNSPMTSSCGRLFDAVAALSGGRQEIRYEAQAAIEFMQAAQNKLGGDFSLFNSVIINNTHVISMESIIENLVSRILAKKTQGQLSQWFHFSLVKSFSHIAGLLREETGLAKIVLSGGVFQNRLLLESLIQNLEKDRFKVFTHVQVPTNDGGIALGQIGIGRKFLSS